MAKQEIKACNMQRKWDFKKKFNIENTSLCN